MQIFKIVPQFYSSILPTAQQVQHPDLQTELPQHCLGLQLSQKAQIFTATTALICTEQGFVVSFPVPLHHPTSVLSLHPLCCLPKAPREFNHTASLHSERSLFSILAWIYTLTSWIFNIPPTHRQRDNFSPSPARTADTLKHMNQRLPAVFPTVLSNYQHLSPVCRNTLKYHCMPGCSPAALLLQVICTPNAGSVTGGDAAHQSDWEQGSAPAPALCACWMPPVNPALTTCNAPKVTFLQETKKL